MFIVDDRATMRAIAEAAHEYQQQAGSGERVVTKELMVRIGLRMHPLSYAQTNDDMEAFGLLLDASEKRPGLGALLAMPFEQLLVMGAARWADQGFPVVQVPEQWAAGQMASSFPPESVRPPWAAFVLDLPQNMLPIVDDHTGKLEYAKRVLVHATTIAGKLHWQWLATVDGTVTLWHHGMTTAQLVGRDECERGNYWEGAAFVAQSTSIDDATSQAIGKLIAGVCLAASNPGQVRPHGKVAAKSPVGDRGRGEREPAARTYRVVGDVRIDVRQALSNWLHQRESSAPSVQTLVRGHWKPKLGERLGHTVWVEPYWRGNRDLPIAVRSHVIPV